MFLKNIINVLKSMLNTTSNTLLGFWDHFLVRLHHPFKEEEEVSISWFHVVFDVRCAKRTYQNLRKSHFQHKKSTIISHQSWQPYSKQQFWPQSPLVVISSWKTESPWHLWLVPEVMPMVCLRRTMWSITSNVVRKAEIDLQRWNIWRIFSYIANIVMDEMFTVKITL